MVALFSYQKMQGSTIYQAYNAQDLVSEPIKYRINLLTGLASVEAAPIVAKSTPAIPRSRRISLKLAKILGIAGIALIAIYLAPVAFNQVRSYMIRAGYYKLSGSEVESLTKAKDAAKVRTLPPFDASLPKDNHLNIPSIGVDTQIEEATYDNYEEALKKGVWRVSNFGEPDLSGAPIILAAHRYGYLAWTNVFRHKSSFYNLPKVEVGDTVTISWQQRKYTYGVYKTETGQEITDYSADLILYTCENLNGPERVFVYAKQIS